MRASRLVVALLLLLAVAAAGFVAWAWEPEIRAVEPPASTAFDPAHIRHGAQLAALGDCQGCHTAPGGAPYAGGVAMKTPFGTIYGNNITPDPNAGIGKWSLAAFRRAMRRGVDRAGQHLYPAFPYDHFTGLTDADTDALYAFLMTRAAAPAQPPPNRLVFPLNVRLSIAAWKLLFFRQGRPPPGPAEGEPGRGPYLVEALAHCGACHTPRNILQAEKRSRALAGGKQEGWDAPALDATSPAPIRWTAESLFAYLRTGSDPLHGAAAGPMQTVVANLRPAPDADVRAIASYVAAAMGEASPGRQAAEAALTSRVGTSDAATTASAAAETEAPTDAPASGAVLYAGTCAGCHAEGSGRPFGGRPLALQTSLSMTSPRNLIQVLLNGIAPGEGEAGPMMPSFADTLTDKQIADLAVYLRGRFGSSQPWTGIEAQVAAIRAGG